MSEKRRDLLVGLFVLCGLAILGTLVVLFGSGPRDLIGGGGYPIYIHFESAAGIRAGTAVTIGGIEVGRVDDIGYVDPLRFDRGIRVTAIVDRECRLPGGSTAVRVEPGLGYGRPPIEINPGPDYDDPLQPGATISGKVRGAVESMVPEDVRSIFTQTAERVSEAAAKLTPVLEDLHEVLRPRSPVDVDRLGGPSGNLSSAVTRIDAAMKNWNETLGDPAVKSHLREAITNIHQISADGKAVAANLKTTSDEARATVSEAKTLVLNTQASVQRLEEEVAVATRDLRTTLERGSQTLDALHGVVVNLSQGDGTISRLLRDPKLYEALVLTAERLAQAVEEFRVLVKDWQQGKIRVGL